MGKRKEDYELYGRDAWLRNPYTGHYARVIKQQLETSELAFMAACQSSSDPAVTRAHEKHMASKRQWELFTRQGKSNDDDF